MNTSTIITRIVVGIVFLVVWALVITTFIRMIGKVDDNIIRMIYKSEFTPVPTLLFLQHHLLFHHQQLRE